MIKSWIYSLFFTLILSGCTSYQTVQESKDYSQRFVASCLNKDRMCIRASCSLQTVTEEAYQDCLNYFGLVFEDENQDINPL